MGKVYVRIDPNGGFERMIWTDEPYSDRNVEIFRLGDDRLGGCRATPYN